MRGFSNVQIHRPTYPEEYCHYDVWAWRTRTTTYRGDQVPGKNDQQHIYETLWSGILVPGNKNHCHDWWWKGSIPYKEREPTEKESSHDKTKSHKSLLTVIKLNIHQKHRFWSFTTDHHMTSISDFGKSPSWFTLCSFRQLADRIALLSAAEVPWWAISVNWRHRSDNYLIIIIFAFELSW